MKTHSLPLVLSIATATLTFSSGCSVLIGQVKPVDEKAKIRFWKDIPTIDPRFQLIPKTGEPGGSSDAAWQSQALESVISINSSCRSQAFPQEIEEVSETLLAQWTKVSGLEQRQTSHSGFSAHVSTGKGTYLGQERKFENWVIQSPKCIYDVVLIAAPKGYESALKTFRSFKDTLNLQ
jgi:hypothetical protein